MRRRETGISALGCLVALAACFLLVFLPAVFMGAMADAARSRARALLGVGPSASGEAPVEGLPEGPTRANARVQGLPEWAPLPPRTVNNAGDRKGLIYYPKARAPFPYIDRAIEWNLDQVLAEYPMKINYVFRPTWQQRILYAGRASNPNGVAPPGTSIHESGCAVDTDFRHIGLNAQLAKIRVFTKYGFDWKGRFDPRGRDGLGGDPVHFEIRPERVGWRSHIEAIAYNQRVYCQLSGDCRR